MTDRSALAVSCLLAILLAIPAVAQESFEPLEPLPVGTTLLSLPSPHVTGPHSWEVQFTHRFTQPVNSGVHSLWGLDGGANVAFGLSYVPMRDLQLFATRSNILDDIELGAKYVVMQQATAIPLSLSVRAGGDVRTERGADDRTSVFAQLVASRLFAERLELYVIPTIVTNAGRAAAGNQSVALFSHAFNVPVAVAFEIVPNLSAVGEFIATNRDLPGTIHSDFGWAVGIKRALGGHHFELLVTNSAATTVDQYTTSTFQGAPLQQGDVHIGFNIERQFGGD